MASGVANATEAYARCVSRTRSAHRTMQYTSVAVKCFVAMCIAVLIRWCHFFHAAWERMGSTGVELGHVKVEANIRHY